MKGGYLTLHREDRLAIWALARPVEVQLGVAAFEASFLYPGAGRQLLCRYRAGFFEHEPAPADIPRHVQSVLRFHEVEFLVYAWENLVRFRENQVAVGDWLTLVAELFGEILPVEAEYFVLVDWLVISYQVLLVNAIC